MVSKRVFRSAGRGAFEMENQEMPQYFRFKLLRALQEPHGLHARWLEHCGKIHDARISTRPTKSGKKEVKVIVSAKIVYRLTSPK